MSIFVTNQTKQKYFRKKHRTNRRANKQNPYFRVAKARKANGFGHQTLHFQNSPIFIMNKAKEAKISMHENLLTLFGDNKTAVDAIPGLSEHIPLYQQMTAAARTRLEGNETSTTDLTKHKNGQKRKLILESERLANKLKMVSVKTGNPLVMDNIPKVRSKWAVGGEASLIARAKTALARAREQETNLATLGYDKDAIDAYDAQIADFDKISGTPEQKRKLRASSNDRLDSEVAALNLFFDENILPAVESEPLAFPDFYAAFTRLSKARSTRRSIETGPAPEAPAMEKDAATPETLSAEKMLGSSAEVAAA